MQAAKTLKPFVTLIDPKELVSDQLLKDVKGEVVLIRHDLGTIICSRSAENMKQQVVSWLNLAGTAENASFITGRITDKGGRFRIINRESAVEIIALWIFEVIPNGMAKVRL